jgi:DNA invertase Pin-like site-specific DNA recombinase
MSQSDENVAFGYVRVSSEEQLEGLSIQSQVEKIREMCERRGYRLEVFKDEGRSAYTDDVAKRPGFKKLLDLIPSRRPSAVVVYSLDRWSRSNVVAAESFQILSAFGVRFISVTESEFDLDNPASSLILTVLSCFARYGSAMTAQHVRRVSDSKFELGVHRGSVPFGYESNPSATKAVPLPPVPKVDEFATVQELFKRARTGFYTCQDLADWLNSRGFRTRNRKKSVSESESDEPAQPRLFTDDSIRGILKNPFYTGLVVRQSRTRKGTATTDERRPGGHPAAVSPEDFDAIQSILRSRHKAPRTATRRTRPYLLGASFTATVVVNWYTVSTAIGTFTTASPVRLAECSALTQESTGLQRLLIARSRTSSFE